MRFDRLASATVALVMSLSAAFADAVLVMAEEPGCVWCARWNKEISHIYPKTAEGIAAPLRRINIHDDLPNELSFSRTLHFTPTFVLILNGVEVSRIEGYPGEDFFWGLLGQMLENAKIELSG